MYKYRHKNRLLANFYAPSSPCPSARQVAAPRSPWPEVIGRFTATPPTQAKPNTQTHTHTEDDYKEICVSA